MKNNILLDLEENYGLSVNKITPVSGGWLNEKWKAGTDKGMILVKEFSQKRFNREKLDIIEQALERQRMLNKEGIPCPEIFPFENRSIRHLDKETSYMVMAFCPGELKNADTATVLHLQSLGNYCGQMHKILSCLPNENVWGHPIDSQNIIDSLWKNFHTRLEKSVEKENPEYHRALLAMEPALKTLEKSFFDSLPKGICHEDFTSDNILFNEEGVTAILDFDRSCYSFLYHDIGRALLCFALEGETMNMEKVSAFIEGYSRHLPLTRADIAVAMAITWCIEVHWWIQPAFFGENRGKANRFRDEILWIRKNWFELDSIFSE